MEVAVIAYPSLSNDDSEWIESFRARYDPAAHRVEAHFTLVFPVETRVDELEQRLATLI